METHVLLVAEVPLRVSTRVPLPRSWVQSRHPSPVRGRGTREEESTLNLGAPRSSVPVCRGGGAPWASPPACSSACGASWQTLLAVASRFWVRLCVCYMLLHFSYEGRNEHVCVEMPRLAWPFKHQRGWCAFPFLREDQRSQLCRCFLWNCTVWVVCPCRRLGEWLPGLPVLEVQGSQASGRDSCRCAFSPWECRTPCLQ